MSEAEGSARVAAAPAQSSPLTSGHVFHWDGMGPMTRGGRPPKGAESAAPDCSFALLWMPAASQEPLLQGRHTSPLLPAGTWGHVPSASPQAVTSMTFCLDPGLLHMAHNTIPTVTGELIWACRGGDPETLPLSVHPVLLVHPAYVQLHTERVEVVPHLHAPDPLLEHMTLVLQAATAATGVAGRLYAEALATALAVHLLRRYAACGGAAGAWRGGLSPSILRRTTAYIQEHLEHELPLAALAAVAQMSPSHFARLFKHATGQPPHQYVLRCRIEYAKQLLTETALPLIEIGLRVGVANHSAFTALFRKHVGTTPRAYRNATQRHA